MQALIVNYDHIAKQCSKLNNKETRKINEFKAKGNLIGLYTSNKNTDELYKLDVDFVICSNGILSFKEGFDYFDYEPLSTEEMKNILKSLQGKFRVMMDSKNGFVKECILYDLENENDIKKQIEEYFNEVVGVSSVDGQIYLFSKKANMDLVVDQLCGIKNINIDNVYVLTDKYEETKINHSVKNIYVLNESDSLVENKDIFYVDNILECMNDLLEDCSFLFTKCE